MLSKPLRHARPRWQGPVVLLMVLGIVGALAAGGFAVWHRTQQRSAELTLPVVTSMPNFRSATITVQASPEDLNVNRVAIVDAVDRTAEITFADGRAIMNDQSQSFVLESGQWTRRPANQPYLDAIAPLFDRARGVTVDDVLPPIVREQVDVVDVEPIEFGGRSLHRFDVVVDLATIMSGSQEGAAALQEFWGADDPTDGGPTAFGASLWVDDEGLVYKVLSESDVDDRRSEWTFEYSAAPFVPVFPAVFIDAPS